MADIHVDRTISTVDLQRLRASLPDELQPREFSAVHKARRDQNGQEFLLFYAPGSHLSDESRRQLFDSGWCAVSTEGRLELSPLRPVDWTLPCFHTTHHDRIDSIFARGLLPGIAVGVASTDRFPDARYFVHVSTTLTDAIKWATFPHLLSIANPTYLQIDISGLSGCMFVDPCSSSGLLLNTHGVPTESLSILGATQIQGILWAEIESMLSHHQKAFDKTPVDALNRLFGEFVRDTPRLTQHICTVALHGFYWRDLQMMRRKDDTAASPRRADCPIVVVKYRGDLYVVDGRRRANKRIQEGKRYDGNPDMIEKPLSAIVVQYNDDKR